jgi:hypothetical protein
MGTGPVWKAAVDDPQLVSSARAVAVEVMSRLRDDEVVESAARGVSVPGRPGWLPHGVAQGHCGLALAFGHLDRCFPGEGWDLVAHEHLSRALKNTAESGVTTLGLFSGLAGIVQTTSYLSNQGARYRNLLGGLDESLLGHIPPQIPAPHAGLAVAEFDLISGWAGVGACLLNRAPASGYDGALPVVLGWLVELTREVDGAPAWHTPHALIADEGMRRRYSTAVANCGLAHGITGVLALLCLAHADGEAVPGHTEAIRRAARWLAAQRIDEGWGPAFPAVVALGADAVAPSSARDAWCYGGPGVARALFLAGAVLDDVRLTDLALATMRAVLRRPVPLRRIDSPGFCHGVAGLLQITLRFAADTSDDEFRVGARRLVEQLLADHRPEAPFGYRSVEPDGTRQDRVGLLDGAPAVALALLAAVTTEPPGWDRLFLLS